jgi:hypothetical protein
MVCKLTLLTPFSHHFFCRRLNGEDFISGITTIPPSVELVPLIRRVNPDFLWREYFECDIEDKMTKVLTWLTVSLQSLTIFISIPTFFFYPGNRAHT